MTVPPIAIALLDALEEPTLLVSGERTVAANPAARSLLGEGLVGQNIRLAIRQPQALDAILAGGDRKLEVLGIGSIDRSWLVRIKRLDPGLLLVRLTDQSARRATERAQVDFVANASHELRTPLASVLGYSETLADDAPLDDETRRRFGEQIQVQAERMLAIIRDLMGLSRIEAGRFAVLKTGVSLPELVREAATAAEALARERSCAIQLALADPLPAVSGDPAQLRQLVDNLLHNALRYGCRPGTEAQVEVSLEQDGRWQRLLVRDHGEGIAARHIPRLTERFYRVDAARSRDSGGTGLGLAIVRQIVERHRGQLEIRSRVGQGTEVEIRLPQG
ncbi:hypothetical protein GCM10022280_24880 [Sphingomonas swuensis]|uniref:histidine kinase n=1 Tax=Sphingomonas swuensis TaxID=977800 RepID=A0ABP7TAA8_9SPHN